jgi:hypothetical protein
MYRSIYSCARMFQHCIFYSLQGVTCGIQNLTILVQVDIGVYNFKHGDEDVRREMIVLFSDQGM